jgi:hypothetical protein
MGVITPQSQLFTEYISRLERQNQMLKRVGFFLFFLCFLAIGLIAWQLKRISRPAAAQGQVLVNKVIYANEFNLVDQNGKTQGVLSGSADGAMLFLNAHNNKPGLMFYPDKSGGSSLSLTSVSGEHLVMLTTDDEFSWVTIGAKEDRGDRIQMAAGAGGQSLTVSDKTGFQAVLGSASLMKPESGATTNTSVAALTLFAKDGRVIWMTPKP